MKPPRIPPLFKDIVQTAISACDGLTFTDHAACPACGGPLTGYDTKKRQFAHMLGDDGQKTLFVRVRRFQCRTCKKICYADEPFYPDTRIGSIIIDLCIALSLTIPVNRIPAYLAAMGIHVTRSSCRLYVQNNSSYYVRNNVRYIETDNIFDIHLPHSIITLSALAADADTGSFVKGKEVLEACGFPSAQRTSLNSRYRLKPWKPLWKEK
ncbi:MAG: hypothetical protein M0R30_03500 [Methanoregula sp.]|jgi:hypothetical protein|uniref:DUF6431 domain-containing protein n=1 Tax=Methanoregula sp. TaxID=2052170 RepID=UPI0025F2AD78|nr:hypothetical protein [Methanoregula sp.]MCK9630685.1 hypothetical protein [Methanoregula sp.]